LILRKEWKEVINNLLLSRKEEDIISKIKQYLSNEIKEKELLEALPFRLNNERGIVEYYKTNGPSDHYGAFQTLPRNLKIIYLHAYQSYIWNMVTSERLKFDKNIILGFFEY
jgi:tRNA pseudouridine13 synthase